MPSVARPTTRRPSPRVAIRLVVVARQGDLGRAHDVGDERIAVERDLVLAGAARHAGLAVRRNPGVVGDVLVQRAAAGDVQDLYPTTDRERRHRTDRRRLRQRALETVVGRVDAVDARVGLLAVAGGIDVGATREHERVDAGEQRLRVTRVVDDHRLAAHAQYRLDVAVGERGRAGVRPLVGAARAGAR